MNKLLTILAGLFIFIILGGTIFLSVGNQQEYTIIDVQIQTELQSNDDGYKTKYLYFCTTDKGEEIVFENEDNVFFWKFRSSDILAKIKKYEENGKPFKIRTAGFRIGFFSAYQNIIEISEV